MKFGIARAGTSGAIFDESPDSVIRAFCQKNRGQKNSQCENHYKRLWDEYDWQKPISTICCPYGLVTTSAVGGVSVPISLTSFWVRGIGDSLVPADIINAATVGDNDIKNMLSVIKGISAGIRDDELSHFEAALHDTRHLNHAITQNAERLLTNAGWVPEANWDFEAIQNDEVSRRALTIFAASRDLSQSISMHEISRHPEQAARDISPYHLHKSFYRQVKISAERMEEKQLKCFLGASLRALQLSSAFRLIPKILLDNAFKYASRGSEVRVLFSESPQFFIIECKNTGPVVRENEITGLFKRGTRGSNRTGVTGQGIGLWLARTIVAANNGWIDLAVSGISVDYSGRRVGETIVTIKLPRSTSIA
jgi:signal transduction histidine kinase